MACTEKFSSVLEEAQFSTKIQKAECAYRGKPASLINWSYIEWHTAAVKKDFGLEVRADLFKTFATAAQVLAPDS